MWAVVVLSAEGGQKRKQRRATVPRRRTQPVFEGPHQAFRNAIGLRSMPVDRHVDEARFGGEVSEYLSPKVRALIANQISQVGRQVLTQATDQLLTGKVCARSEGG